jgi:hypothetical protein
MNVEIFVSIHFYPGLFPRNILQRCIESVILIDWERYIPHYLVVDEKGGSIVTRTCSTEKGKLFVENENMPDVEKPQRRPRSM